MWRYLLITTAVLWFQMTVLTHAPDPELAHSVIDKHIEQRRVAADTPNSQHANMFTIPMGGKSWNYFNSPKLLVKGGKLVVGYDSKTYQVEELAVVDASASIPTGPIPKERVDITLVRTVRGRTIYILLSESDGIWGSFKRWFSKKQNRHLIMSGVSETHREFDAFNQQLEQSKHFLVDNLGDLMSGSELQSLTIDQWKIVREGGTYVVSETELMPICLKAVTTVVGAVLRELPSQKDNEEGRRQLAVGQTVMGLLGQGVGAVLWGFGFCIGSSANFLGPYFKSISDGLAAGTLLRDFALTKLDFLR